MNRFIQDTQKTKKNKKKKTFHLHYIMIQN
jgi:hypothetical protein